MRTWTLLATAVLCAVAMIGWGYMHPFGDPRGGADAGAAGEADHLLGNPQMFAQAKASMLGNGGLVVTATPVPGDAKRGRAVFDRRCTGCHTMDANREGPKLRGVFGRKAGQVPGFIYTPAFKTSGITWNEESLDRWLSDTDALIPDNAMGYRVGKPTERADVIAYLKMAK
jgi:cytochrome c